MQSLRRICLEMSVPKIPSYDTSRAGVVLEWHDVVDQLASFAGSEPGKHRCESIEFLNEPSLVRMAIDETSEARDFIERGGSAGFNSLTDPASSLARVRAKGVLDAKELLRISEVLHLARRTRSAFLEKVEDYPNLETIAKAIHTDIELEKKITTSIDREGNVMDSATPELKTLRGRYNSIHSQVHDVMKKLMDSHRFDDLLQDEFFSLRNGRYVLPVKIEKKSAVDGIVHDISGSGLSLFIEPKEVTHLNNMLRTTELEIDREIYRILSSLSWKVEEKADQIEATVQSLVELDFIFSRARYSIRLNASAPIINTNGVVNLKEARHPALVWQGENVIPNDIELDQDRQVLIITGPNTGGKTVALKTVGICALMARAGLHIPASPNSEMAVFRRVFALIGDEQSIQNSLSSFSAHLLTLRYIVVHLVPESLVLIDEVGEGTDPTQGIALSKAMIDHLQTGKVRTVITTHFRELTTLAYTHPNVANASMEFDGAQFEPTYKLVRDLPGKSSAFEIAQRLGLKQSIIDKAREYASGSDSRLDEVMAGLEEQRSNLQRQAQSARQEKLKAREAAEKQAAVYAEIKKKKSKIIAEELKRLRDRFDHAKKQISDILKDLQNAPTVKRIEKGREKIRNVLHRMEVDHSPKVEEKKNDPTLIPIDDWNDIKVGDRVYVSRVQNHGKVDKLPDAKGMVRLVVAGAKMTLPTSDCCMRKGDAKEKQKAKSNRNFVGLSGDSSADDTPSLSVDLRGMTAEEALERVKEFLDQSYRSNHGQVTLIHGHGTGVLKREVREYCKSSPYIKGWRPGKRGEGGDGATVVELDL